MTDGRTQICCQKIKGPGFTAPYLDGLMPPQEEKQITLHGTLHLSLSVAHKQKVYLQVLQVNHVEVVQWTTVWWSWSFFFFCPFNLKVFCLRGRRSVEVQLPELNHWVTVTRITGNLYQRMQMWVVAFLIGTCRKGLNFSTFGKRGGGAFLQIEYYVSSLFVFLLCNCYKCYIIKTSDDPISGVIPPTSLRSALFRLSSSLFGHFRLLPPAAFSSLCDQLESLLLLPVTRQRCSLTRALTCRPE